MTLPFERWGSGGRILVMLHGFTGNRTAFRHLEPLMGSGLSVVAPDLPGHGEAPLPSRMGRDGFEETLAALEMLLDALGTQVDLLGYSQGGRIALALAARAPSRIDRIVLESASPGLKRHRERAVRREQDEALARTLETQGLGAFLDRWESMPLFGGIRRLPEAEQRQLRMRRESSTPEGLAAALRTLSAGVQPSYWAALPRLHMPALLLTGRDDEKYTEMAKRMAQQIPHAYHRAFEECGHAPHLEKPQEYAAEVLSFLQAPWAEESERRGARCLTP